MVFIETSGTAMTYSEGTHCPNCFAELDPTHHICGASCGWHAATDGASHDPRRPLPPFTQLNNYVFGTVIGRGSFGIVYAARALGVPDEQLAVKEYFPKAITGVTRQQDEAIAVEQENKQLYEELRDNFFTEANHQFRASQRTSHIVSIKSVFVHHGTVYMLSGPISQDKNGLSLS